MPRPYSNTLCLKCHDGARRFMAEDVHLGVGGTVSGELVSNETACIECHKPAHRIKITANGRAAG